MGETCIIDQFRNQSERCLPVDANIYYTNHKHTGVALIFNHKHIQGESIRRGTDCDRDRLSRVFHSYGFQVRVYDDLRYNEMKRVLKNVSLENHSNNNCIAVAVMSHGTKNKLLAKDKSYNVEKLWKPFVGKDCLTLVGKPKLFIIQACRGTKYDEGTQYTEEKEIGFDVTDSSSNYAFSGNPITADLIVMYSSFEEHFSWRNPLHGSWFIQSLCIELEDAAANDRPVELLYLLSAVSRRVAYEYQSHVPDDEYMDKMKQMPSFVSTLTKMFYLKKSESISI